MNATINELRGHFGFPPVADGDQIVISTLPMYKNDEIILQSVPFLCERNKDTIWNRLTTGSIFVYDESSFQFLDIEKMSVKHRVIITYCHPGTPEYDSYGCFTCLVIRKNRKRYLRPIV